GDKHAEDFVAISQNAKIPAMVDDDGPGGAPISMMESGAILMYLAEKMQSPLLPTEMRARYQVIQWLMFQMGGVGPMYGQAHHFLKFAKEDVPYGKKRYHDETKRLYGVLDRRLDEAAYLGGDAYSIADIATYPWVARFAWHQVDLGAFPAVKSWFDGLTDQPAVKKGMIAVPE
ncbi:MAG: glutathione S-transferase C-terminal domain-containing protein, partial [Rhodospirillaceae bacterium]|nr:glutathione S-transferase C-terminal domain-containing protein [Rhodospirillaceae bacterium]